MAGTTEDFVFRLNQQVSGPATAATSALQRMENQIVREQNALGRLEAKLSSAKAKLEEMSQGTADPAAVAAFDKQSAAVDTLQGKLSEAQETLAIMAQAKVSPEDLEKAKGDAAGLAAQLEEARAKLDELGQATGPQVDIDAYREQAAAIEQMGDQAQAQTDKIEALNEKMNEGGEEAGGAAPNFRAMAGATRMLGGDMGGTASKGLRLVGMMMKLGPEAAIAIAAFIVLSAAITAFVAIVAKGISAAGALRDEILKLQGASKGSASTAADLEASISKVSGSSSLARDKITGYALELQKAGLKGAELQRALEAMAIAGSAGGDDVASAFLNTVKGAKAAGGSVDALSAKMKAQLGGVAAEQALGLSAQLSKLGENITAIFSGADIEPFLKGLHAILGLFDQNNGVAKSLKATITAFVNAAIGGMLKLAIVLVKTYIALKSSTAGWFAVKAVVYGLLVVLGLTVAALMIAVGLIAIAAFTMALPFILVVAAVMLLWDALVFLWDGLMSIGAGISAFGSTVKAGIGAAFDWVVGKINGVLAWLGGLSLAGIGTALIDGLANGIKSAGAAVLSAITGVVSGAIDAAKSLLHINSPSKIFHAMGEGGIGGGMVAGLGAAEDNVSDASAGMAQAAVDGASVVKGNASGKGGSSGGERTINFWNCTFGTTTKEEIRQWMREVFEEENLSAEPIGAN